MQSISAYRLRFKLLVLVACLLAFVAVPPVHANPKYAAIVIEANTGTVLHERYADKSLYPASLTKMMTLYMTFAAIRDGRLTMDQALTVSRHAAGKPASKLGLRRGETITVRQAVRSSAVKSANDAATVLAEAIGGSESNFAVMMTKQARDLGMNNTRFKNASGLTARGQRSTARDMAILSQRLFSDFPVQSKVFARKETSYKGKRLRATNKLLGKYRGADGIKTGYTSASGFNLAATAERGSHRIIAVVFGGKSGSRRDRHVRKLMDTAFKKLQTVTLPSPPSISRVPRMKPVRNSNGVFVARPQAPSAIAALRTSDTSAPQVAASLAALNEITATDNKNTVVASKAVDRGWAIQVGAYRSRSLAEGIIRRARSAGHSHLNWSSSHIARRISRGRPIYQARFSGFDRTKARAACRALEANGIDCYSFKAKGG